VGMPRRMMSAGTGVSVILRYWSDCTSFVMVPAPLRCVFTVFYKKFTAFLVFWQGMAHAAGKFFHLFPFVFVRGKNTLQRLWACVKMTIIYKPAGRRACLENL
ncbi:MAG: hypothetical protein PUA63_01385, partial [Oscillospiraceae bacterium]|nr:hypothetical protein [Oscillospiraceae bacterium]